MYTEASQVSITDNKIDFTATTLTAQSVPKLHEQLSQFKPDSDKQVILNFSGVKRLDNAALATLINLVFKQNAQGKKIHIQGASHAVAKSLKILQLDRYIEIRDTLIKPLAN